MKTPIKWMAGNHVAANLLMMFFVIGGLITVFSIKQEVFPEIDMDIIQVTVAYPGAGPEEVEEGIVLKVEEALSGIVGIKRITSRAAEGGGLVTAEVLSGEDADQVQEDIKSAVDRITTFPGEAEKPSITKLVNRSEVISVMLFGDVSERSLRELAEGVRDELLAFPDITQAGLGGVRPYEISIEVPERNLRRHGLTLGGIAQRVRKASLDLPAGSVKTSGGEILIRTKEKKYSGAGYEDITIIEHADGTELRLGDIARVKDSFAETDSYARFDGKPAAMVYVYRVGEQKPTVISKVVRDYIDEKKLTLPDSVDISVWLDFSDYFKSRRDLLVKNAMIGLTLVFLVLGLFLQIRLAGWVMVGIPISFLGAMFFMPSLDVTISMLSLFAFILALGIVVDDAIVVGENIYTHRQMGKKYFTAAVDGALEVGMPVIFAVLTTVAAFTPLVFISGTMGKFIKVIPFVVVPILLVSLVESLFVLPSHLSRGKKQDGEEKGLLRLIERVQVGFGGMLQRFVQGRYKRFLELTLRNRYATLAASMAIFLIIMGVVGGGIVKFRFMPAVDGDIIIVSLRMPIGTPIEETERAQRHVLEKAALLEEEFKDRLPDGVKLIRHIYALVGSTIVPAGPIGESARSASHKADLAMLLTKSELRGIPASDVSAVWRKLVGEVRGADSLTFKSSLVHFGANIDIRFSHDDIGVLSEVAGKLKEVLAQYPGVNDITDNYSQGKRELKLRLKPEARTLGITEELLGRRVREAFYGAEALRFQRGRNELKVMVRYPEEDRKSLASLKSMRIRTQGGIEVPFETAASAEPGRGYSEINRSERRRVVNVTAAVDDAVANAGDILTEVRGVVLPRLIEDYPGLSFDLEGEEKERRDSMGSMLRGFIMALFVIYALLAIPFRSFTQPLIVMAAIPYGLVGAVLGHWIMGFDLSILSLFGIVALSGVVINDSLLLIDYMNRRIIEGMPLMEAVLEAAQRRFRPILLTSLTTSLGLAPMIAETSVQAQFLIPMAISLSFGILFATGITLVLIPSLSLILEDVRRLIGLKALHTEEREVAKAAEGGQ